MTPAPDLAALRDEVDNGRCDRCGWALATTIEDGCVRGACSLRPVQPVRTTSVPRDMLRWLLDQAARVAELEQSRDRAIQERDAEIDRLPREVEELHARVATLERERDEARDQLALYHEHLATCDTKGDALDAATARADRLAGENARLRVALTDALTFRGQAERIAGYDNGIALLRDRDRLEAALREARLQHSELATCPMCGPMINAALAPPPAGGTGG